MNLSGEERRKNGEKKKRKQMKLLEIEEEIDQGENCNEIEDNAGKRQEKEIKHHGIERMRRGSYDGEDEESKH